MNAITANQKCHYKEKQTQISVLTNATLINIYPNKMNALIVILDVNPVATLVMINHVHHAILLII